tara:strand:+ start:2105 stop:3574 length:1470 start_codon:yes stop_codon:yes gene_type:complete
MADSSFSDTVLATCLQSQVEHSILLNTAKEASEQCALGNKKFFSISLSVPKVDALAVLEQHSLKKGFEFYWEKPIDDFAIAAAGELTRIQSTGDTRFKDASVNGKSILKKVHHFTTLNHSLAVVHLLGGFSFFNHNISKHWKDFGAGSFTLPEWLIIRDGKFNILTISFELSKEDTAQLIIDRLYDKLENLNGICQASSYSIGPELDQHNVLNVPTQNSSEHKRWINSIIKAKAKISEKAFSKIVIARELPIKLDKPVSDTHILNRLRHQYPDCYSFLIRQNEQSSFIGCSPERLASFKGNFLFTEGLAGSTPRGKSASEDAKFEFNLLRSDKNLAEHNIVLDAIHENLAAFSDSIEFQSKPGIKKLSNVQHLHTPIRARIKAGVSKTEVLKTLHPTPAVGGFPKEKAVPYISNFEDFERGWYAGPIGWINANGEGEFAVAIRSGLIKNEEVRFFAGCGIVEASDPEIEWEETNLKFIPMLSALEYAGK